MTTAIKFLFILAFLFNVIAWSPLMDHFSSLKPDVIKNHNQAATLCSSTDKTTQPNTVKTSYNFLPYESCNQKNSYLNKSLQDSVFSKQPMQGSELSPLCTFAGLNHKLKGAYQKSCQSRPKFTRHKPCLNRNYHRFVHNQITMAAQCFYMDPKTLFSLYSTESFLQVNVKPSRWQSAEGISQLMPQYSVKHINKKIHSLNLKNDNQYKKNLRHFISKAKNKGCSKYLRNLENTVLKKERKNQCQNLDIDQKVGQDIYYSIAYGLESIKTNINYLIKKDSLFNDDYSHFFDQQKDKALVKTLHCSIMSGANKTLCLKNSKLKVENFINQGAKEVNKSIKHLKRLIKSVGLYNFEEKIVNNFPQFKLHVTSDQFAEAQLTPLLNNSFVKNYCQIDTIPQMSWYPVKTIKQKNKSVEQLTLDMTKLLDEVRECKRQFAFAYIDIFHSMNKNNQNILNEVSFYQHNGGTKMNILFRKYIKHLGHKKASKLKYSTFTGKRHESFRRFIIKKEGPSQASNFLYNIPSRDRRGKRTPGSLASTTHNMKIIKKSLSKIKLETFKNEVDLNEEKIQHFQLISSNSGFKKLCSHY